MTRGPTNACISFHCDGDYAHSTTQIALNPESEYEGGRLCFYSKGTGALTVLSRKPGSCSHHTAKVLHGVTNLISGTRKSLFVLDNGNGLGERDVIDVTQEEMAAFVAAHDIPPRKHDVQDAPASSCTNLKREHGDDDCDQNCCVSDMKKRSGGSSPTAEEKPQECFAFYEDLLEVPDFNVVSICPQCKRFVAAHPHKP